MSSQIQRQIIEWWLREAGWRKELELLLNGDRVSVWEDEKILEVDGGESYTTV